MSDDEPRRPDPEALLQAVGRDSRGRLKVFLGMSPGVGKTFEMLREARSRKAGGGEVLVGLVETHGRKETEALLRGLEVLPRKATEYKGRAFLEFDLDEALRRKPALLLVDEYAHSNVLGSRHPKRWQDVEELLAAGVDVWTTLNVQHLESLVDVVWKITGVRQRETVPDSALSRADDIELVDVTPGELRQRLADGKVYLGETARVAAERFFKPENLTALRELALRRAAETVDDQLIGAMKRAGVEGPWAAGERILVLIGGAPVAAALVRAARRLSDSMANAPWTVAHVDQPNRPPMNAASAHRLNEALKLAQQLGGSTAVLTGDDIVETVLDYVRRNNITQIVIGRTPHRRFRALFGRSLPQALLERSGGAALHIVTETAADAPLIPGFSRSRVKRPWRGYIAAAGCVAAASGVSVIVDQMSNQTANLAMIYLLSVLAAGIGWGMGPALFAAALAAVTYNFFFLQPRLSFYIGHAADVLTFLVFFVVASAIGWLTGRVRDQSRATARKASAIASLLEASRRLSASAGQKEAAQALAEQLAVAVGAKAMILLPQDGDIAPAAGAPTLETLSTADMAAARWAWERGEAAGAGTGTLPNAAWTFRPLVGVKNRSGVAGVEADVQDADERFVLALLDQGAVALERAEFAADAADAEALRRSDRLRDALLNSISHDLRTPLSTVLGSTTTLIDFGEKLDKPVRRDLLFSIREEAERLNRYVGDLLDMTKLEGGGLEPRADLVDVREPLEAAIDRVSRRLGERTLERDFAPSLSMVKADPGLLEQAVVNILENAVSYSPDKSRIEVAAHEDPDEVVISIEDQGRGIPRGELERVFDKFRRLDVPTDRGKSAGLGLSIAKGFVEAMGGRIAAVSPVTATGGTRLLISLPKSIRTHEFLL
ncbi:MAG TPA: sensor histidine kinase KdpD [Caulobacteraceae bacterium]|jgi:two-component system sensor histidine kinase KdpD|nr:sensor histidine kinase KdpD [Caulobacteraceae bacterium]